MFERFTKEARAVVVGAQAVAHQAGSRSIDTRHLLAALLDAPGPARRALTEARADPGALAAAVRDEIAAGGLDPDALAALGIDLTAVVDRADAIFGPDALGRAGRRGGHVRFGRDAKKALELALREAVRLHERRIDGGHLLLGLLRADNPARALLVRAGVDLAAVRSRLEERTAA